MRNDDGSADRPAPFYRTVPPLIGALSVVRHQVYWDPGLVQDRASDLRIESIERFERETWQRCAEVKKHFRQTEFSRFQPNERMKYIYVWWKGMLAHVRVQKHTEYIAILTSINFSRNLLLDPHLRRDSAQWIGSLDYYRQTHCAHERVSVETWLGSLASIGRKETEKQAALNGLLGPLSAVQGEDNLLARFDSDFGMDELRRLVVPRRMTGPSPRDGSAGKTGDETGGRMAAEPVRPPPEMIIDFRGLVTSAPPQEGKGLSATLGLRRNRLFRKCFTEAAKPVRDTGHLIAEADRKAIEEEARALPQGRLDPWFLRKIGQYWRAVQPDGEVRYSEEIEFSATGLLDGRALFITHQALPIADGPGTARIAEQLSPIRFFLHCRRSDERQIGRVVDRLCTMATVRAALERHAAEILGKRKDLRVLLGSIEKSIDGLISQNKILNMIILKSGDESEMASLQRDLNEQREIDRPKSKEDVQLEAAGNKSIDYFTRFSNEKPINEQTTRDVLRALSGGMNALEGVIQKKLQLRSKKDRENVWGADDYMEYKVERATYYFDKFSRLEDQIRIARVEGFQTYPELVKRRVQDAFAYVRNAKEYLREIADQRTRMGAQIGNITQIVEAHESDEEQRKIAEIQDFAEFALLTFLLPYYLGAILGYALEALGWKSGKYMIGFILIMFFTAINLIKRSLEGKPTEPGQLYKFKVFISNINVLSVLAMIVAALFIVLLIAKDADPDKGGKTAAAAGRAPPLHSRCAGSMKKVVQEFCSGDERALSNAFSAETFAHS